jgi:hypothetical protein
VNLSKPDKKLESLFFRIFTSVLPLFVVFHNGFGLTILVRSTLFKTILTHILILSIIMKVNELCSAFVHVPVPFRPNRRGFCDGFLSAATCVQPNPINNELLVGPQSCEVRIALHFAGFQI